MAEQRYAVLVGSSQFPEEPKLTPLRCPEQDVDGLAKVLASPQRGQFLEPTLLKNAPHYQITRAILRTLRQAGKDDLVLLYYSGHGKLDIDGHLYLTAADTVLEELEATAIAVRTIRDYIQKAACNKVVFILDCCYSGAAGHGLRGSVDDQLQLVSRGRGTYLMTASTAIETAQEREGDHYGVFTKHLIQGIESGDADQDRDGLIGVDELYRYVHDRVSEESSQQPTKWSLNVRGDLIIARSGRQPRQERAEQLRGLLFDLAKEKRIPDEFMVEALKIVERPIDQLKGPERQQDVLLDELWQQRLQPIYFALQWAKLRDERGQSPEKAAQTEPQVIKELMYKAYKGFRDRLKDGSETPEMVYLPGGTFKMGDSQGIGDKDERPVHEVTLDAFAIGRYPVTVGEFRRFVKKTGYQTEAEQGDGAYVCDDKVWNQELDANWRNPYFSQAENHPVVCVSWNDATAYCEWLSEQTAQRYSLPSEAQWEYACRASSDTAYCFGDDEQLLEKYAWYSKNAGRKTHPVGEKLPNAWKLYDMHGNVWEWVRDWYGDYSKKPQHNPSGLEKGSIRVYRGGGWLKGADGCRSAFRGWYAPVNCYDFLGFRLARHI